VDKVAIQFTGKAKFRFCPSLRKKVVSPISRPASSNNPPPEEPGEIDAVVWMTFDPSP
jgi:hypothetical protein